MNDSPLRSGCQPSAGREPETVDLDAVAAAYEDERRVWREVVGARLEREREAAERRDPEPSARSQFL